MSKRLDPTASSTKMTWICILLLLGVHFLATYFLNAQPIIILCEAAPIEQQHQQNLQSQPEYPFLLTTTARDGNQKNALLLQLPNWKQQQQQQQPLDTFASPLLAPTPDEHGNHHQLIHHTSNWPKLESNQDQLLQEWMMMIQNLKNYNDLLKNLASGSNVFDEDEQLGENDYELGIKENEMYNYNNNNNEGIWGNDFNNNNKKKDYYSYYYNDLPYNKRALMMKYYNDELPTRNKKALSSLSRFCFFWSSACAANGSVEINSNLTDDSDPYNNGNGTALAALQNNGTNPDGSNSYAHRPISKSFGMRLRYGK